MKKESSMNRVQIPVTLQEFEKILHGEVFREGEGLYPFLHSKPIKWVAKKGGGDDWAIYYALSDKDKYYICAYGDKVFIKDNIKSLVPCEASVLKKYRI